MHTVPRLRLQIAVLLVLLVAESALAQANSGVSASAKQSSTTADAAQTEHLLGLDPSVEQLRSLQTQRACGSAASLEELTVRQELLESIQGSALDIDGVLGEISNERGKLSDLRAALQARRDRTVAKLNAAALIAGSGLGVAATATQFTPLSGRTQNIGDGIGVGSGAASTILSIMAVRRQHGPSGSVGEVPNMLAPLFDATPVLNTYYPPAVAEYLRSVPAGEDETRGTRLEQLKAEWYQAGRLDAADPAKRHDKITAVTASTNKGVKVSIDDLTDRMAMLGDVEGRVSLMKRDLATLMHSLKRKREDCNLGAEPDR